MKIKRQSKIVELVQTHDISTQEELSEHFGIEAWVYDSQKRMYFNPQGTSRYVGSRNPLGKESPDVMLMSAQYARGRV